MALLGIDFGTANIRVAVVPPSGEPAPASVVTVPAMVAFGKGHISAGEAVLMTVGALPDVVVPDIKRLLGRSAGEAVVERAAERAGFAAVMCDDQLTLRDGDDGPQMKVLDGASELLRYACEAATGSKGHEAVITVPNWFTAPQRHALEAAAQHANIKVLRFISDTAATALWAAGAHGERGKLAVVELGAGGASVCLLSASGQALEVLSAHGDDTMGGSDIDAELVAAASSVDDRTSRELLRQACESLKRQVADKDEVSRELTLAGKRTTITVERWQLDLLLAQLAGRVKKLCEMALEDAGWRSGAQATVLASGGTTTLAAVSSQIENALGKPPERPPSDLNAAALGAALQAAISTLRAEGPQIVDGERLPAEEPTSEPKREGGYALHGPVTTHKKQIGRFRPSVKRTRRRKTAPPSAPPPAGADVTIPSAAPTGFSQPAPAADSSPSNAGASDSRPSVSNSGPSVSDAGASDAGASDAGASDAGASDAGASAPSAATSSSERVAEPSSDGGIVDEDSSEGIIDEESTFSGLDEETKAKKRKSNRMRAVRRRLGSRPQMAAISMPPRSSDGTELSLPTEGALTRPASAKDMLGLAISRPLEQDDLDPIALPVLLRRVLARRQVVGSLSISAHNFNLCVDIEAGSAMMTREQHAKMMRAFDLDEASWRVTKDRADKHKKFDLHPLARLALDGVRAMLRRFSPDELDDALGALLDYCPQVRPERSTMPKRLGLGGRELRLIETAMTGAYDARAAIEQGGIGRSTTLQLYMLLHLFDVIMWTEVGGSQPAAATLPKKKRATLIMGRDDVVAIINEPEAEQQKRTTKAFAFIPQPAASGGDDADEGPQEDETDDR